MLNKASISCNMNLVLRPLEDYNSPTWSIIIMLIMLLGGVSYYIYTIMRMSFKEMKDGSDGSTKQEELLQLPSDGD